MPDFLFIHPSKPATNLLKNPRLRDEWELYSEERRDVKGRRTLALKDAEAELSERVYCRLITRSRTTSQVPVRGWGSPCLHR